MLSIIDFQDNQKWDEVVKSFENYEVNYLNGYVNAFYRQGDGEPLLVYYNDNETRAINVIMKRDISKIEDLTNKIPANTWFDLSTPYGYGGFLIEGKNYEKVNKAYEKYCKEEGFICEFVRFHLINEYHLKYNGEIETNTRNVVRDLEVPLDLMFMDFEHKVRKSIKKANKAELEIEVDLDGKRLNEFLSIYYGTMDRSNANKTFYYPKEFFENLNKMENNFVYLHVWYQKK
ncbi:hypothetical protein [Planococcus faecalis]|nr:hypothetical protein [Planococcus faecalis]